MGVWVNMVNGAYLLYNNQIRTCPQKLEQSHVSKYGNKSRLAHEHVFHLFNVYPVVYLSISIFVWVCIFVSSILSVLYLPLMLFSTVLCVICLPLFVFSSCTTPLITAPLPPPRSIFISSPPAFVQTSLSDVTQYSGIKGGGMPPCFLSLPLSLPPCLLSWKPALVTIK